MIPIESTVAEGNLDMSGPSVELHRKWEAKIVGFRASGLSGAKWCVKHGFREKQLYSWLAKFKDTVARTETPSRWLRVEIDEVVAPTSVIEIRVGKAAIGVTPGFDLKLLAEVVRAPELC